MLLTTIQLVNKVGVSHKLSVAEAGSTENYKELEDWMSGTKDVNFR